EPGYFQFGSKVTCFGRSTLPVQQALSGASQVDALKSVVAKNGELVLPFDPTEVLDNLPLERYARDDGWKRGSQNILKKIYYFLRPYTSLSFRRQVQRFRSRNWRKLFFPSWPVDTTVENISRQLLLASMKAKNVDKVPFVWFWPKGANG